MSTFYNISNYESQLETYHGDVFNIAHDGSAITLDQEPGLSLNTVNLTNDWAFFTVFKSSSLLTECVWSIDSGVSGERYMDVHHSSGHTLTLWFDGVETSIKYTDEATLPLDAWVFVGVTYDLSENLLYFGCHLAGQSTTTVDPKFLSYNPATTPSVAAGRVFRFFRPVHTDANYFNGSIDKYRITSYLNTLAISHVSYFVFSSVSQANGWLHNDTNSYSQFTTSINIEIDEYLKASSKQTKFSNMCPYDNNNTCLFRRQDFGSVITAYTSSTETLNSFPEKNIFFQTINTGMHYFERNNKLLYVNQHANGVVGQLFYVLPNGTDIQPTQKVQITDLATNGTYSRGRGDLHGRYFFGTKLAVDGTTHQLFRTDHDGLNEITVDCLTLLGVNAKVEAHVCNPDDDLLYFPHPTTDLLKSVDYNFENYNETYTLQLHTGLYASIEYADGFLYFGNKNPNAIGNNTALWRYNLENGDLDRFSFPYSIVTHAADYQVLFVDRPHNRMLMSGNDKTYHLQFPTTQTVNNFHAGGVYKGFRDSTSVDLMWDPIDSVTGYNLLQDGVIIASNIPETSFKVTGLVDDTEYRFTMESTTDGSTFVPQKYYNTVYHSSSTHHFFPDLPNLTDGVLLSSTCGWADPYTAEDILINVAHNVYNYNIATGVRTLLGDIRINVGNAVMRQYSNKKVYHVYNGQTRLLNAGIDISNRTGSASVGTYLADPAFTVFDHALTSSPTDTASLVSFTSSLDGNLIYYSTTNEDIWKYDSPMNTSTLIYAGEGSSNTRGLSLDPLDQNSMVFYDNGILKHIDLTTLAVTEIQTGMSVAYNAELYGGVVYGTRWHGSFFKINVDGTNYEDLMKPGINFTGLLLDTINKRVILFEGIGTISSIKVYADPTIADLPDDPSLFAVIPRPISLDLAYQAIDGATGYAIRYTIGTAGASDVFISSTEFTDKLMHSIKNLQPGSTYTVYLYYSTNTAVPNILVGSSEKSTLPNLPGNYDASSFANEAGDGGFDFTTLDASSLLSISEVMNELFSTGAEIKFSVGSSSTKAKFLKRGESTTIADEESIAIPFNTSSGSGQDATLTLDSGSVVVSYDESNDEVSIGGTVYASGQSLILDGKKVTVYNV